GHDGLAPGEGRRQYRQQQQEAGLVDRAVERHRTAVARDDRPAAKIEEGRFLQCRIAAAYHGSLMWLPDVCPQRLSISQAAVRDVLCDSRAAGSDNPRPRWRPDAMPGPSSGYSAVW